MQSYFAQATTVFRPTGLFDSIAKFEMMLLRGMASMTPYAELKA